MLGTHTYSSWDLGPGSWDPQQFRNNASAQKAFQNKTKNRKLLEETDDRNVSLMRGCPPEKAMIFYLPGLPIFD